MAALVITRKPDDRQTIPVTTGPVIEQESPVSVDVLPAAPEPEVTAMISRDITPKKTDRSDIARNAEGTVIVIDKGDHLMEIFREGQLVKRYGIAVGKNRGDKQRVGDMRTPEGTFPIVQIQNASGWTHDFRDGKGEIKGAYGPYFIRLGTPGWRGIGIHGTHEPNSIGTDVTEGCVRVNNNDIKEIRKMVNVGDTVVIRR
ncbi:MAG: L,D-transpeptidase [Synergistaceae bacterium]|jgi:lipoprotein-anchoring transpeptidase ErfK/SrfK|nr:L,D-transpeptidase [Synergistaceae bacterium]